MTSEQTRPKPAPVTGLRHFVAATQYSIGGLRRLWQETAMRHVALIFLPYLILLYLIDTNLMGFILAFGLLLLWIMVEALNTALECIVDHLAKDWQEYARDAKDLGSLASMSVLLINGLFLGAQLLRYFEIV